MEYSSWLPLVSYWHETELVWTLIQQLHAIVNICHCLSWLCQICGLMGEHGLEPAHSQLQGFHREAVNNYFDADEEVEMTWDFKKFRFLSYPTLFWWSAQDWMLRLVCCVGIASSLMILVGGWYFQSSMPWLMIILWWTCCLVNSSISQICQTFALQTESMMVESTFLFGLASCFSVYNLEWMVRFAAWLLGPESALTVHSMLSNGPNFSLWLFRWLAFRIMLSAGMVKWFGSAEWRKLTAMDYHYFTMPIPSRLSKWFHQRPKTFHQIETLFSLLIEGPTCVMCLMPFAWARWLAAVQFIGLMVMINISGTFCYLGLLTAATCASLLDDNFFSFVIPTSSKHLDVTSALYHSEGFELSWLLSSAWFLLMLAVVVIYMACTLVTVMVTSNLKSRIPRDLLEFFVEIQHTSLVHVIGFFAVMTTYRWEVIIEGSHDGREWKRYGYHYKPSHPDDVPHWNPVWYWPRLDWQLWMVPLRVRPFLAVVNGPPIYPPWLDRLMKQLMEKNPDVEKLVIPPPEFRTSPPKYIRLQLYDYKYTPNTRDECKRVSEEAIAEVHQIILGESTQSTSSMVNISHMPKDKESEFTRYDLENCSQTVGKWWIETGPITQLAEFPRLRFS